MTGQTWDDLAFGIGSGLAAEVGEAWAWLVPPGWQPVLCAMVGGIFLRTDTGVQWLDCLSGQIEWVAGDVAAFENRLTSDAPAFDDWFRPGLVARLHADGKVPRPGQCYGCLVPPVFQLGRMLPGNVEVAAVREVLVGTAAAHRHIAAMPRGNTMRLRAAG